MRVKRSDMAHQQDHIRLLALCRANAVDWSLLARQSSRPDGLAALLSGAILERRTPEAQRRALRNCLSNGLPFDEMARSLGQWQRRGIRLTTVLDDDYPLNLRGVFNLPPFLFYNGHLQEDDAKSVAVVGTRNPSHLGIKRAGQMAAHLARSGVTVLSGLARGIDTAAHRATLRARGRTIAVLGSGLERIYPPENSDLAAEIATSGAVVSQFWPDAPPAKYNFPRRNIVMSGLGQGTVVIEASATSGAKMQARLALQHGKKVFLLRSLVDQYSWAREYVKRGALVVEDVNGVVDSLRSTDQIRNEANERIQLAFQLA